jgi:hypothetical protein
MGKFNLPSFKLDMPGFKPPGGGKLTKPPDLPTTKPPSTKPAVPDNVKPSTKSPDAPEAPTVKPDTDAPSANIKPEPSKPSGIGSSLALGGGLTGLGLFMSGGAGGLGSQAVNAAGQVATAAVAAEAAKEMFNKALEALGKFTENPINLAIVAGVIGLVVLR